MTEPVSSGEGQGRAALIDNLDGGRSCRTCIKNSGSPLMNSLRRSIDNGLKNSRFGIVVLSNAFFAKNWTQYELDGLVTREMEGHKVILPIWHMVSKNQVLNYSPSLADKKAINSSLSTIDEIVTQLGEVLDEKQT
jgi:hypothetical protein